MVAGVSDAEMVCPKLKPELVPRVNKVVIQSLAVEMMPSII